MLKGQAKTDYQREYMRRRRNSAKIASAAIKKPVIEHTACSEEVLKEHTYVPYYD